MTKRESRSARAVRNIGVVLRVATVLLAGCAFSRSTDRPSLLLVTIDTLRADHVGCYGYGRATTPVLDGLAARGVRFENAFTPIPITLPSHTSLLTGLYPHQHGIRDNGVYRLPESAATLAEALRAAGYRTAAFVGAHVVSRTYGIDQGFDVFDDEMVEPLRAENPIEDGAALPDYTRRWSERWTRPYQRRAAEVVDRATAWVAKADGDRPFFCWVHLFDPHEPYDPPEPWDRLFDAGYEGPVDGRADSYHEAARTGDAEDRLRHLRRMIALYDGEIAYTDHELGRLLAAIPEGALVVVAGDHGEAFGEHGQWFDHGGAIFDETVHVPLLFAGPWGGEGGRARDDLASLVDVTPTILGRLGIAPGEGLPGRVLFAGEDDEPPAVYCETMCSKTAVPTPVCFRGVRGRNWSCVVRIRKRDALERRVRLHSLVEDPGETADLGESAPDTLAAMRAEFDRLVRLGTEDDKHPSHFRPFTDEDERLEGLRALGYVE